GPYRDVTGPRPARGTVGGRRYDRPPMPEATTTAPAPASEPTPDGADAKRPSPPVTRLVLARHAVTAQTGPMLSGRLPGIDLSDEGQRQADALAERLGGRGGRL